MKSKQPSLFLFIAVLIAGLAVPPASAQTWTKVVAGADPVPDRPPGTTFLGILGGSLGPPVLADGRLLFCALESDGNVGLWTAAASGASLTRLADRTTPVPSGSGTLYDHGPFDLGGGRVVFRGRAYGPDQAGYYSGPVTGGALIRLADQNTLIPDTTNRFNVGSFDFYLDAFHCDGTNYLFKPSGLGAVLFAGVTTTDAGLRRFADSSTPIAEPNYPTLNEFTEPDLSGANAVARVAGGGKSAIYRLPLSGLVTNGGGFVANATRIASANTPVPGSPTNFHAATFERPKMDGQTVVFRAGWTTNGVDFVYGLYSWVSGALYKLVDTRTPVPGGTGNFSAVNSLVSYAVSGGLVAFQGWDSQREGIYAVRATGGAIRKVVAIGDTFPWGTVAGNTGAFYQPPLQANSLEGDRLALRLDSTPLVGAGVYAAQLTSLFAPVLRIRVEGQDAVLSTDQSEVGVQYQLRRRAALAPGSWIDVGSPTNGTGGTLQWRDAGRLSESQQYYRLLVTN